MIILMGVAGAGKSMQGHLLAEEHGYEWVSTGELFRQLVTGKRKQEMIEGKLLSDKEVILLVDNTLKSMNLDKEFVLDGFPRTINQAEWLLRQTQEGRLKISAIFNFQASRKVVQDRLMKRGRQDDTESAIEKRFEEYERVTLPIIDFLKHESMPVYDINADQKPKSIHDQLVTYIDKL